MSLSGFTASLCTWYPVHLLHLELNHCVQAQEEEQFLASVATPRGKTTAILFTITSIFALWAPRIIMILYHLYGHPSRTAGWCTSCPMLPTCWPFWTRPSTSSSTACFISKRFRTMAAATLKAFFKCQKQPVQFYTNHNFSITSSPWISRPTHTVSRCWCTSMTKMENL